MKPSLVLIALLLAPAGVVLSATTAKTAPGKAKAAPVKAAPVVLRESAGHPVESLRLSSDRKTAFVAAHTGQSEVYDLLARKKVREFPGGMGAYQLAVSPDGSEVASSITNFWISINNVAAGTQRAHFFLGDVGGATSLDWSPDGKMLASASSNQVALFDRDGKMLGKREGDISVGPNVVAFSPDGTRLVAGWSDRTLAIYDTANFEKTQFAYQGPRLHQIALLPGHQGAVTTLAWSKDGRLLASGDTNGQVRIWDFAAQKSQGSWTVGGCSPITSLAWAPSGASVAVATQTLEGGAAVQIWDVAKNKARLMWKNAQAATQIAFASDGQTLVVGDTSGSVSLVPITAFEWLKTSPPETIRSLAKVICGDWRRQRGGGGADQSVCGGCGKCPSRCGSV